MSARCRWIHALGTGALVLLLLAACGGRSDDAPATPDAGATAETTTPPDAGVADTPRWETAVPDVPLTDVSPEVLGADVPPRADLRPRRDVPPPPDTWRANYPDVPIPSADIAFESRCSPAGDEAWNIYDLQDPTCPDHPDPEPATAPGLRVTLRQVVVTAVFSDTIFVQEEHGGPYSGLAVYLHGLSPTDFAVGDRVTLTGGYTEFYGLTQVWLEEHQHHGAGQPPAPLVVAHPAHVVTGGPLAEPLEGVLVELRDLWVYSTNPDCPKEFGEFVVGAELRIDDVGPYEYRPTVGDHLGRVAGVMHYTFGNSKLEPRDDGDIELVSQGTGGYTKCFDYGCIVPEDQPTTDALVVNEIMADPFGEDTQREYLELYNATPYVVDLRGWYLADCTGQSHEITAQTGVRVQPGRYVVLGPNADPELNGGVPVNYAYGEEFYLPNTVGSVILFDADGQLVDQVRYEMFDPWPHQTGRPIELRHPGRDNNRSENWGLGSVPYGSESGYGTPGFQNEPQQP